MVHREITDERYQIDSLDGLRGFAALIVVFSHTSNLEMYFLPFLDLSGIGKSGVFLFFLLSSFLLTLPLLSKGVGLLKISFMSHYLQRRFFRIYPLYTLYLLLAVISTFFFSIYLEKNTNGIPFDLDWYGFFEHITFQEGQGVTWSIAVEFKFYFILPILVLLANLILPISFNITILFFLTLLFLTQVIFPQSQILANDTRLLPYMPIFLVGVLLAIIQHKINEKGPLSERLKMAFRLLGFFGIIGIVAMTPLVHSTIWGRVDNDYFHKQLILHALFWSLVLLSAVNVQGLIQRFFTMPTLRFFGAISFSLYLFHIVFIRAVGHLELNGYLSAWFVLFVSTVAAYISYRLIEEPISKYKVNRNSFTSIFSQKKYAHSEHISTPHPPKPAFTHLFQCRIYSPMQLHAAPCS